MELTIIIIAGIIAGIVMKLVANMVAVDFKAKITMYFIVMIVLNILIFIAVYLKNGFCIQTFIIAFIFSLFFLLSIVDYHFHAIPDMLSLGLFSAALFSGGFIDSLHASLIVVGFMTMLRYFVSYFLDKEAMGEGDIIIGGAMGAFIGISMAFMSLFVAALLALPFAYIAKLSGKPVPFVPFLFMGTFLTYIFSPYAEAYLKSIGL